MKNKTITILYSEMAGYLISSLASLRSKGYYVEVYHWPINKEAPFIFEKIDGINFYDRSTFTEAELEKKIKQTNPSAILCSGWMDKGYLKIIKKYKGRIPTIIALDNHWVGGMKQRIMQFTSPLFLKQIFSHAWVAGEPQAIYARKLGFKGDKLLDGFYSADLSFFQTQYEKNKDSKHQLYPKVFLYVGRYIPHKGIYEMWKAFTELKDEFPNQWKLYCVGAGDDFEKRVEHEDIKHFGFVQPAQLSDIIKAAGVFVLPSHFEPWGVVVHEFAAAGMPLLLSNEIGAASAFLEESVNGFSFEARSSDEIKRVMKSIMQMDNQALIKMSVSSHQRADWINPDKWSEKLIQLL